MRGQKRAPGLGDPLTPPVGMVYAAMRACMHACMHGVEQRWKTSLTAEHIREELKTLCVHSVLSDAHCKRDISGRSTQQGDNMRIKFFSSFYCHGDRRKGEGKSECLLEMLQISIHSSSCSLALDANLVILVPTYTTYSVTHTWLSLRHENIVVQTQFVRTHR